MPAPRASIRGRDVVTSPRPSSAPHRIAHRVHERPPGVVEEASHVMRCFPVRVSPNDVGAKRLVGHKRVCLDKRIDVSSGRPQVSKTRDMLHVSRTPSPSILSCPRAARRVRGVRAIDNESFSGQPQDAEVLGREQRLERTHGPTFGARLGHARPTVISRGATLVAARPACATDLRQLMSRTCAQS